MVERLYSTTECNKLIIGCCDRIGIGGLTLRVFISHSRLSRVSERQVKFVVKYTGVPPLSTQKLDTLKLVQNSMMKQTNESKKTLFIFEVSLLS